MSTVLVTGATTPMGKALVQALLRDPDVTEILAAAIEDGCEELEALSPGRIHYFRADLTRPREVRALLFGPARRIAVTTLVHLAFHRSAALTGATAHRFHVEATRELLSLAEEHPTIRRVVYASSVDVYEIRSGQPFLIGEDHALDLSRAVPQRVRDRVEADVTVCLRMGAAPFSIAVLRLAEILSPQSGSQLYDYLQSRVALRPMGFDPMLNLLTLEDAVRALAFAVRSDATGIFNVPGADTLPLSRIIRKWGCLCLAVPGPLLTPLYKLRASSVGMEFRYDLNYRRFHFNAVMDGSRARTILGYEPSVPITWPTGTPRRAAPASA